MSVFIAAGGNIDRVGRIAEPVDISNRSSRELGLVYVSGGNTVVAGEKIVTDHNVPENLAADTPCRSVIIQAKTTNIQSVFIGNADAQCFELLPGTSVTLPVANLNLVFVRVQADGEGVNYLGAF
jgi:hypothetical protein